MTASGNLKTGLKTRDGRFGYEVEVFADAAAMRAEVDSPLYRGGAWVKDAGGVLDPAKLAQGLYEAALRAGVRVYEKSPVESIEDAGGGPHRRQGRAGRYVARFRP